LFGYGVSLVIRWLSIVKSISDLSDHASPVVPTCPRR
jgi:hypothetical protein